MLNQLRDRTFEKLNGWKFLIILLLTIGVFLRFAHLDEKVYSADEVRSILRLSGYTSQEFIDKTYKGDIISLEEIQKYQKPNSEKNLNDAIHALARNPEHPPLYHMITRFWMQIFNAPIEARIASILISYLALFGLYWLCLELFESPIPGWIVMALFAVSPFQILAAQNTTQYSLWSGMILLSSAALLKALRGNNKSYWLIYAVTLALGLYTHLFFTIVAFGQGIYVLIRERLHFNKNLIAYCFSSLLGVLIFIPWILVFFSNLEKVEKNTQYYRQFKTNINEIIKTLYSNLGNVFIDFFHTRGKLENFLHFLILMLIIYSIYFMIRNTKIKVWSFILILILITPVVQIVPDLISQSIRSLQSRYYLPCFLGIQLAVAYLISNRIISTSVNIWLRRFWQFIFLTLLLLGIISGIILSRTNDAGLDDQRGTASSQNLAIASVINQAKKPLVISDTTHSFVLALSHLLKPEASFQLFPKNDIEQWQQKLNLSEDTQDFSDVFLYFPNDDFLNFIKQDKNFYLESVQGKIYKIVKN